jgi:hypothetical protein
MVQRFRGSEVQGFKPNSKFGVKLAIIWGMSIFYEGFGSLMPFLSLTLNVEP